MNFQIVVFLFLSVFFPIKQENPDELLWQSDKKLTWENFKGKPDINTGPSAVTVCRIKMKYNSKKDALFVSIWSVLVQSKSWVRKDFKITELLKHEQLHFDIAELYARKLKQKVVSLKIKKALADKTITEIDEKNDEELKQYQDLYDRETNHSGNRKKQMEWEKKVKAELKALNEFRNTEIGVLLK